MTEPLGGPWEVWMQLLVANHIMNNGDTEYHKTYILYEYTRGSSLVDFIWARTVDLEVFQMGKIPRYSSNNTNFCDKSHS